MKLSKSALLATIAAGAVVLSGCDDKKNTTQPVIEQQKSSVSAQSVQEQQPNIQTIEQAVSVNGISRTINNTDEPNVVIVYEVENLSDKAIKSVRWQGHSLVDGKVISFTDTPFSFEQPLAPKAKFNVVVTTFIAAMAEASRPIAINPDIKVDIETKVLGVEFSDGSKVSAQ